MERDKVHDGYAVRLLGGEWRFHGKWNRRSAPVLTCSSDPNIIAYCSWEMLFVPGLSELSDKLVRYAERAFARTIEFAQALTEVKDIYDLTKLQTDFIEAQISAVTELVRDLGDIATKPVMRSLPTPTPNAAQVTVTLKHFAGTRLYNGDRSR